MKRRNKIVTNHNQARGSGRQLPIQRVRTKKSLQAQRLFRFIPMWAFFVILAMIATSRFIAVEGAGFQIDRLNAQLSALKRQEKSLEVTKARLSSLPRIQSIAESKLGMSMPKAVVLIRASQPRIKSLGTKSNKSTAKSHNNMLQAMVAYLKSVIPGL